VSSRCTCAAIDWKDAEGVVGKSWFLDRDIQGVVGKHDHVSDTHETIHSFINLVSESIYCIFLNMVSNGK
jgi:hypothetical protein